jgi:hypothetical protein
MNGPGNSANLLLVALPGPENRGSFLALIPERVSSTLVDF